MPVDRVGEDAELYALGSLDDVERARVVRHARECDECARRIAAAEATVLHLIELGEQPVHVPRALVLPERTPAPATPRGNGRWIAAVAAAFLIGLLPWGIARVQQRGASGDTLAASAMLAGHFSHAPFVALAAGAPKAKAIYPLEGGWLYIIAAPGAALDIAVIGPGERRTIATLPPSTATRTLFVRYPGPINSVALLDGTTPVAIAHL